MWKHLKHPNIVPLMGVTLTPLQLISDRMSGGEMSGYIKKHPDVDRLKLVGVPPVVFIPALTPVTSYPTSLRVSAISTPVMWFTGISRECVVLQLIPLLD